MIRIYILFICAFALVNSHAQSIDFHQNNLNRALKQANKENKLIFVDGYTVWCGPCKWMDANVFSDPQVSEFFNNSFINLKVNLEEGKGVDFAEKYKPPAFPTFYFLNGAGEVQHMALGAFDVENLMQIAHDALRPTGNLAYFKNNYNSNRNNGPFLKEYAMLLKFLRLPENKEVVRDYLATQTDLSGETNAKFIFDQVGINIESRLFNYMINNLQDFYTHIGEYKVDTKIINAIDGSLGPAGTPEELEAKIQELLPKESQRLIDRMYLDQLMSGDVIEDVTIFTNMAYFYVFHWKPQDWEFVNNLAWTIYETGTTTDHFEKGKAIAQESVALDNNYFNNDTVAALCYQLRQKDHAITYAMKAIGLAQKEGVDASSTLGLLRLIQQLD